MERVSEHGAALDMTHTALVGCLLSVLLATACAKLRPRNPSGPREGELSKYDLLNGTARAQNRIAGDRPRSFSRDFEEYLPNCDYRDATGKWAPEPGCASCALAAR